MIPTVLEMIQKTDRVLNTPIAFDGVHPDLDEIRVAAFQFHDVGGKYKATVLAHLLAHFLGILAHLCRGSGFPFLL